MNSESRKFSHALVREFYATYKGELKKQYPRGNLWKGRDSIMSLTVHGVRVNISPQIILRFLNGPDFQPPVNTVEIKYRTDEM